MSPRRTPKTGPLTGATGTPLTRVKRAPKPPQAKPRPQTPGRRPKPLAKARTAQTTVLGLSPRATALVLEAVREHRRKPQTTDDDRTILENICKELCAPSHE